MRPTSPLLFSFLVIVFSSNLVSAQAHKHRDIFNNTNIGNNNRNRLHRHCTEPYSDQFFNRDYVGLMNVNRLYIDNELRSYTRFHCLTSDQVRRLALLYLTDRDKYIFLTFALNYVYDIENYAMVGTVLTNPNSNNEFYRFLIKEGVPTGDYYVTAYPYNAPPPVYGQTAVGQNNPYYPNQAPQYGNPNQAPQYGNPSQAPQYGNPSQAPQYGNPSQAPQYGNPNQAPQYGNPNQTPQYGNPNQAPQYGNPNQTPQYGNPNQAPQYGNPNQAPQYGNANQPYPDPNSRGVNGGYAGLMTYQEFEVVKDKIKLNSLETGRLDAAKSITKGNVLSAIQVAEIARLLNFDVNRLDFAKFAFDYTYDRNNYNVVEEALSFQKNKEELQLYVRNKK